jgi:hypothetical protein
MADTKISALPASTTPLAGTEVLPIVQSGATKQVSIANITAGRAISATQLTLTTGNLIVASGQGIDFSATPGTGTSELLNDYEEGTFTPSQGPGIVLVGTFSSSGKYTKIGKQVTVVFQLNGSTSVAAPVGGQITDNLPFVSELNVFAVGVAAVFNGPMAPIIVGASAATVFTAIGPADSIYCTLTYFV